MPESLAERFDLFDDIVNKKRPGTSATSTILYHLVAKEVGDAGCIRIQMRKAPIKFVKKDVMDLRAIARNQGLARAGM